jgi:hypothetical protein
MPTGGDILSTPTNELRNFRDFLSQKLSNGGAELSPEEALDEWRTGHPEIQAEDDVAAIQEALDDLAGGEQPVLFEEFDKKFRAKHQLPARP